MTADPLAPGPTRPFPPFGNEFDGAPATLTADRRLLRDAIADVYGLTPRD